MENDTKNTAEEMIDVKQIEECVKTIAEGGTVRDLKGLTDAEMEVIYSMGYNFYKTGNYEDADKVFRYLVYLDHTCQKYWIALGSVLQARRIFDQAVTAYGYAGFLDLNNPKPQYYSAQCFLALGDKASAESALNALEEFAPKDSPFRAKAAELRKKINGEG